MNTVRVLNKSVLLIILAVGLVLLCVISTDVVLKYNDARIERGVQERMKQLQEDDTDNELPARAVLALTSTVC